MEHTSTLTSNASSSKKIVVTFSIQTRDKKPFSKLVRMLKARPTILYLLVEIKTFSLISARFLYVFSVTQWVECLAQ